MSCRHSRRKGFLVRGGEGIHRTLNQSESFPPQNVNLPPSSQIPTPQTQNMPPRNITEQLTFLPAASRPSSTEAQKKQPTLKYSHTLVPVRSTKYNRSSAPIQSTTSGIASTHNNPIVEKPSAAKAIMSSLNSLDKSLLKGKSSLMLLPRATPSDPSTNQQNSSNLSGKFSPNDSRPASSLSTSFSDSRHAPSLSTSLLDTCVFLPHRARPNVAATLVSPSLFLSDSDDDLFTQTTRPGKFLPSDSRPASSLSTSLLDPCV